ncbi:MAG: Aminopeptidase N [Candidatus Marinimicrobia bacterium]|nr:Aminopeptidase N [Candidatus Neomarinimicrobiota bacterium]
MEILQVSGPDGNSLDFEHTGTRLLIDLPEKLGSGDESTVQIQYKVEEPRLGLYFVQPTEEYPDKPVQIWTQGQDEDSKYWFPCFDYPNEKASSEMIATVDEEFFALSNGKLLETTHDAEAGTKIYHWKQVIPHVSYLITLVAGKFTEHTEHYKDISISYYVTPGREEEGERSFGKTPDMVRFFSEKLNFKYPYEKYAQIAVDDFVFGGMENTTATTQTALTLHDERAHLDFESEPLVAHELAHQWFGDLLTCKDWSHAWLNEGFATYFEALYREEDLGEDEFRYKLHQNAQRYFGEDKKYRRPIVVDTYREPIDIFDRHLYEKGSLVLNMLRKELGDETFWQVMNHYVTTHQQQNVETIDLIRAIEDVTGRNMKKFFDQWVFGAGFPEITVNYTWEPDEDGEAGTAKITVKQTQETKKKTSIFDVPIDVRFVSDGDATEKQIRLQEKEQVFYFHIDSKPERFEFDPKNWILKQLKLEVPQDLLLNQLTNAEDVMCRIYAAKALQENASAKVVDALSEALYSEEFWGVQAEIAKVLGEIKSERARNTLIDALRIEHPKARRAVVEALGNYHDETTAEAVKSLAEEDASYFVESVANTSLGKTRVDWVTKEIQKSLDKESFNEVIRAGVFNGLAELKSEENIPVLLEWTENGKPPMARAAAASALGKLGEEKPEVKQRLLDLLKPDEHFRVKISAVNGLQELNDASTVPALTSFGNREPNGMLKRLGNMAARTIQGSQKQSKAVRELQDEVEKLRSDRMSLVDRLEKVESQLNGKV